MAADATITFNTSVDPSGFEQGVSGLEEKSGSLADAIALIKEAISKSFQPGEIETTSAAMMKQQAVVDALQQKLNDIATIQMRTPLLEELQKDLDSATEEVSRFDERIEELNRILSDQQVMNDPGFANAIAKWQEELDATVDKSITAGEKVSALREKLSGIEMPSQPKESTEELAQKLAIANKRLEEMKAKAEQSGKKVTDSAKQSSSGMDGLAKAVGHATSRIKNLIVGAFVFNVLRGAIKNFKDYVFAAAKENEAFAQSFNQFKANTYAAIQPLMGLLIPALTKVSQVFAYISGIIAQIVAMITNQNVKQLYEQARARDLATQKNQAESAKARLDYEKKVAKASADRAAAEEKEAARIAKELEKQEKQQAAHAAKNAKAIENQAKQQQKYLEKLKKSNKEQERSTAAFDDLITLQSNAADEVDTIAPVEDIQFEELKFDEITSSLKDAIVEGFDAGFQEGFGIFDNLTQPQELTQKITDMFATILTITAIVMLVLGVILLFTGNIPVGLGLIVAAAIIIWKALPAIWKNLSQETKNIIEASLIIGGLILMVLGIILLFTGASTAIGLGLLAAGAIIAYKGITMAWKDMSEDTKKAIEATLMIVGLVAVVLGCVLLFTGAATTVGLALIALGIPVVATGIALAWGSMSDEVKTAIEAVLEIVGVIAIIIGCMLLFGGVSTPFGIALIAAGVVAIATPIALNWSNMSLQEKISAILEVVGYVAIAIGCLLLFTGALIPLGIGLIALGAAAVVTSIALDWNSMSLEEKVGAILKVVGVIAVIIGVIMLFTGVGTPLGIGMIIFGAVAIASAVAIDSDEIKNKVRESFDKIKFAIAKFKVVLGCILVCTGVGLKPGLSLIRDGLDDMGISTEEMDDAAVLNLVGGMLRNIQAMWEDFTGKIKEKLDGVKEFVHTIVDAIGNAFGNAGNWISNTWHDIWNGITDFIKNSINGIIGFINGMINAVGNGINFVIDSMNKLKIEMPDWMGGKTFGFNIARVQLPNIPLLAQGAVLPGGDPFLAVVNDQPRGQRNVETPLATIEEAVSNVLQQYLPALMDSRNAPVIARIEGDEAGLFRWLRIGLEREGVRASAF